MDYDSGGGEGACVVMLTAVGAETRCVPCLATIRLAMQSGTLVPAARKVMPMMTSGIPNVYPIIVTCRRKGGKLLILSVFKLNIVLLQ